MRFNLVGDRELAWQQRKAESFTVSPFYCGNNRLGIAPVLNMGATMQPPWALPVAISGAAVSPNMGYISSPAITFLLALFNVRLGAWLGNPKIELSSGRNILRRFNRRLAEETWKRPGPLLLFGRSSKNRSAWTTDVKPYVFLSDGGHFENLGIYEMVRRRCHLIVACDASQDEKYNFEDLGNAIRKIRVDLGVPIVLTRIDIYPRTPAPPKDSKYFAVGEIRYCDSEGGGTNGVLIYLKPAVYRQSEPADVRNYASDHNAFPHDSTANQFFNEIAIRKLSGTGGIHHHRSDEQRSGERRGGNRSRRS